MKKQNELERMQENIQILRQKLHDLEAEHKRLKEGAQQLSTLTDKVIGAIVRACGEPDGDGWKLSFPYELFATDYAAEAVRDEDTASYVIRVHKFGEAK